MFVVHDASGRYSGQFFFGNDYWLGSKTLCWELGNVETNNEVPPFPVHFYVAKIRININQQLTPVVSYIIIMLVNTSSISKDCFISGVHQPVKAYYCLLSNYAHQFLRYLM